MKESSLLSFVMSLLSKRIGKFIALIILLVPGVNLAFAIALIVLLCKFNSAMQTYERNRSIVSDPFQNMIFSPETCEVTGQE